MAAVNGFVVVCGLTFLLFIAGLHNYVSNFEDNGCEMTYMFEYPQYVKISFPEDITVQFARYGLYAYGEGQLTESLRKMKFSGIPVLFIPGNSGSYKQARSLASVSLRKAINSHLPFHFDYFTIDLNDEYSGLFGGILEEQTQFVLHCIHRILKLYKPGPNSPQSVILIGHSMGGMVAKGLFLRPDFNPALVHLIITLATPHKAPVISLDHHLAEYHSKVNSYWITEKKNKAGNISHVTLVSIGGGQRDVLVRSSLTQTEEADISVLSTAIPAVWLSTDHLSSLWCKELVMVIVRALFDIVDYRSKQIIYDPEERKYVFEYHLIKRTAGKRMALAYHARDATFYVDGVWNEYLRRQFSINEPSGVANVVYTMIRLVDDPKHEWLLAEAVNVEVNDWVFACSANVVYESTRMCDYGINLSNRTQLIPSSTSLKRKMIYLNLADIKKMGFSHVILRILPTRDPVLLNVDIHSSARKVTVNLPSLLRFMKHVPVIETTSDAALHYSLSFPGFEHIWQAYYLHIIPHSCRLAVHHAVAMMQVPWSKEDLYIKINDLVEKPLQLRLHTPKPSSYKKGDAVQVRLILDPTCRYSISIQSSFLDSLGQMVRFYASMLLPYVAAVLLLALRAQMISLHQTRDCSMFHSALASGGKPYYILPIVKIAGRFLSVAIIAKLILRVFPQLDPVLLNESNMDFLLLPFLLYMVAFAVAYVMGLACWVAVIFNGTAANKIALRFLAKTITGTISWSEWMLSGLAKLPVTAAGFLIALAFWTCGALSLCVGGAFFFLKLCKMYEEYLEVLFKYSIYLLSRFKKRGKKKKENDKNKTEQNEVAEKQLVKVEETTSGYSAENIERTGAQESVEERTADDPEQEIKEEADRKTENKNEVVTDGNSSNEGDSGKEIQSSSKDLVKKGEGDQNEEEAGKVEKKEVEKKVDNEKEDDKKKEEKKGDGPSVLCSLHFNFTLLLLWVTCTCVNVPAVLVWAHNYGFSTKLEPDPSFITGVVLCFCAGILWQKQAPNPDLKHYEVVGNILYAVAVLILVFCPISIHRLSPLLMAVFVIVTLHQLFGRSRPQESSPNTPLVDTDLINEKVGTDIPSPSKPKQA